MKKTTLLAAAVAMLLAPAALFAQKETPPAPAAPKNFNVPRVTRFDLPNGLKVRLVPYGEMWRTGANKNTIVTFSAPVKIAGKDLKAGIAELEKRMRAAAADLEFETAARLRDEIKRLEALDLGLPPPPASSSFAGRPKKDPTPQPLGPGGGGWDPDKRKAGRKRGR